MFEYIITHLDQKNSYLYKRIKEIYFKYQEWTCEMGYRVDRSLMKSNERNTSRKESQ